MKMNRIVPVIVVAVSYIVLMSIGSRQTNTKTKEQNSYDVETKFLLTYNCKSVNLSPRNEQFRANIDYFNYIDIKKNSITKYQK